MLFNYIKVCKPTQFSNFNKLNVSTQVKEKWNLFTSVCLERKPIITQDLNELELTFQKYLSQVEFERSLKSDHELRHENDQKQAKLLKNATKEDIDLDVTTVQTAQDFKDACIEELSRFQFAKRTADEKEENNMKSLKRRLNKSLVFVTKQKIGSKSYFLPPQALRKEGETLRQSAERILTDSCGKEAKVKIYGNAPVGFYKYKYPKDLRKDGIVGAKIFVYFARYLKGEIATNSDYKWLDRSEMGKELPEDYYKSLSKFLIEEQSEDNKNHIVQ